jgi:hypothetical protein
MFLEGMNPSCSAIEDTFLASPNFGLKLMLTLDNHLQNFHETVATARNISLLPPSDWRFLVDGAERLLWDLGERVPPRSIIPFLLAGVSSGIAPKAPVPVHTKPEPVIGGGGEFPKESRELHAALGNREVVLALAWAVPAGLTNKDFFPR